MFSSLNNRKRNERGVSPLRLFHVAVISIPLTNQNGQRLDGTWHDGFKWIQRCQTRRIFFRSGGWGWKTQLRVYVLSVGGMRKRQVGGWVRGRGDWSVGERTDWWCLCGLCLLLTFVVSLGAFLLLIYLKHTGRHVAFILNCEWYWKQTKEESTYSNILSKCSKEWPFFLYIYKLDNTWFNLVLFVLATLTLLICVVWNTLAGYSFFPDWLFCPPFAWGEVESEQTAPFSLLVNQWASTLQSSEVFRVSGLSHPSRVSGPSQITPATHFPPSS